MMPPSAPAAAPHLAVQSADNIGESIRDAAQRAAEQAREAAQHTREAQQNVREAQQQVRDAQQEWRDAQQQLRQARTADQRGAANQAVAGAQDAVREAEAAVREAEAQFRSGGMVYTTQQPPDFRTMIPPQAVDIAFGFFTLLAVMVVGWPLSRAFGRRIERRGAAPALDGSVAEQLQRIEQNVEAMSIEVERISESQRFMVKLHERSAGALER
jgi:gas vesicle protein